MKFAFLQLLAAAGAGFFVQNAVAVPIRVVVVSSHQEGSAMPPNVRFGFPAAAANRLEGAPVAAPTVSSDSGVKSIPVSAQNGHRRRPCSGARARFRKKFMKARLKLVEKAIAMTNMFRKLVGLPPLQRARVTVTPNSDNTGGIVRVTPLPFIGTPVNVEGHKSFMGLADPKSPDSPPDGHRAHRHHHKHAHAHRHHRSFFRRIHHALMSLGAWEGRAVAFVLGCGIGVLLRMLYVLVIVTYRTIRGDRDEDNVQHEYAIVCDHYDDAGEIVIPPPQYTIQTVLATADVKVPVDE